MHIYGAKAIQSQKFFFLNKIIRQEIIAALNTAIKKTKKLFLYPKTNPDIAINFISAKPKLSLLKKFISNIKILIKKNPRTRSKKIILLKPSTHKIRLKNPQIHFIFEK